MRTWEVMICLPGLNLPHYFRSEAEPTYEQVNAAWMERSKVPLVRDPSSVSLRDAYPAIAYAKEISVRDLTTPAA